MNDAIFLQSKLNVIEFYGLVAARLIKSNRIERNLKKLYNSVCGLESDYPDSVNIIHSTSTISNGTNQSNL